jgi:hypothetical protein
MERRTLVLVLVLVLAELSLAILHIPITRSKIRAESSKEVEYDGYFAPLFGNIAETHIFYTSIMIGNQSFSVLVGMQINIQNQTNNSKQTNKTQ